MMWKDPRLPFANALLTSKHRRLRRRRKRSRRRNERMRQAKLRRDLSRNRAAMRREGRIARRTYRKDVRKGRRQLRRTNRKLRTEAIVATRRRYIRLAKQLEKSCKGFKRIGRKVNPKAGYRSFSCATHACQTPLHHHEEEWQPPPSPLCQLTSLVTMTRTTISVGSCRMLAIG